VQPAADAFAREVDVVEGEQRTGRRHCHDPSRASWTGDG
jgi:hypothetical protein